MALIDVERVRNSGGFPGDLVKDGQIESAISEVQRLTERKFNTSFKGSREMEFFDGTGMRYFYLSKNPVLRLEDAESNDESVDLDDVFVDFNSGRVTYKDSSDRSTFLKGFNSIKVKYWHGLLLPSSVVTESTGGVSAGKDVVFEVDSVDGFKVGDWLRLESFENVTSAKVKSVNGNEITVDKVVVNFEDEFDVIKLEVPDEYKRFIALEAVIYLAINAIGATYVFNASYSLGDLNVNKGVPYTHWQESLNQSVKERDRLWGVLKPRFSVQ